MTEADDVVTAQQMLVLADAQAVTAIKVGADAHGPQAALAIGADHAAVKLGTAARAIGKQPDPARLGDRGIFQQAGKAQEHRAAGGVADALTKGQAGAETAAEIGLDLVGLGLEQLAHQGAMGALDHAAERGVKAEIAEGLAEIGAFDAAGIILPAAFAAIQVSHQRQIGVAGLGIGTGAAGVHHLETVIAIGTRIHAQDMGVSLTSRATAPAPELGSE